MSSSVDVDTYLEIARQNNMIITHVAETHIHADFLSGSRELAALTGAKQMYQSIKKFAELPDYIQVRPGHGAGSACGKALGAVPSSTVGYEKIRNWALQYPTNEPGFVQYLLADQPEPPKYFAMMKKLNKVDRSLLTEVPKQKKLSTSELVANLGTGVKLIDARNKLDFAAGMNEWVNTRNPIISEN